MSRFSQNIIDSNNFEKWLKDHASLLLIPTAFLLWIQTILSSTAERISDFGLVTALPLTYFIAVGLLTLSFFITLLRKGKQVSLCAHVFFLILFLHLTPLLIEGARQRFAYSSYGVSDYIVRNGVVAPDVIGYHNWPVFQIFVAIFAVTTGINPDFIVKLGSPTLIEILLFFPLYFFFNSISSSGQQKWLAIWGFYIADWAGARLFLSSQALGFLLIVLILGLLVRLNNTVFHKRQNAGRSIISIILLLYLAVVAGHALSSLIPVSILCVLFAAKSLNHKGLLACFIVMVTSWNVYVAKTYFANNVSKFVSHLFDVETIFHTNLGGANYYQIGERLLTNQARIAYSAIFFLLAFAGFLVSYRKKTIGNNDKMMLMALAGIGILSTVLVYGGELFQRLWLFGLPMIVYFAVKNFDSRKMFIVLVIFFMAVAPVMLIWVRYGGERFDYIPPSEIEGASFLYSSVSYGYLIGGNPWALFRNSYDKYKSVDINFYDAQNNITFTLADLKMDDENWSVYVCINRGEIEYYRRMYNASTIFEKIEADLEASPYYCKVYSNPDFDMYVTPTNPEP
jgi:hypothetical protein